MNDLLINKIIHGDCLEVMKSIEDKSIDLILCDLPFGKTNCVWDIIISFESLWDQYNRIIKNNRPIVLFGVEPFSSLLRISNLKNFKYDWVWDKIKGTGFLNAKKQPMRNHEIISVFYKDQCLYNPQKTTNHINKKSFKRKELQSEVYGKITKDSLYESTDRYPRSILIFSTDTQKISIHPTQKPVALFEYLIKTYTNEGGLVLDNCSGSGTAGIAAINTNRNFILIEKDEEYFNMSSKRIADRLNQKQEANDLLSFITNDEETANE
jgi:DNA modification methylase